MLHFEELDFCTTPIGDLMLRRRRMAQFGDLDIFEVKLGEHFLMTSLFHESEVQLAKRGLAACKGTELDVVVGGLGLGYTAAAALEDPRVARLAVIDYLEPVIRWHEQGLVPLGAELTADPRCHFVHADFFALAKEEGQGFDPQAPGRQHDAILLDIDHTPTHVLDPANAHFYSPEGLAELQTQLKPGGVFALWADGVPDSTFTEHLQRCFATAESHLIEFANPITGGTSTGAVYVALRD